MIADLKIVDDETVTAFGQKFDVPRVLEAGIAFIKAFAAEVVPAVEERPTMRFRGDGGRRQPLDENAFARLRRETLHIAKTWDVTTECARADIGPFALRFYPLGRDDLQRFGAEGTPMLVGETSREDLDPTPAIDFMPTKGLPIFGRKDIAMLKELIPRHAPTGTRFDLETVPCLRFPHRAFDAGYGRLRISLLTIPVNP